jgi:hypothetical protein
VAVVVMVMMMMMMMMMMRRRRMMMMMMMMMMTTIGGVEEFEYPALRRLSNYCEQNTDAFVFYVSQRGWWGW